MAPSENGSKRSGDRINVFKGLGSKYKEAWFYVTRWSARILGGYKQLPRVLQIGIIYLTVGLAVAGIFCWQIWSLRATYPYISENNPDNTVPPLDSDSLGITTGEHPAKSDSILPETKGDQNHEIISPAAEVKDTGEVRGDEKPATCMDLDGVWPVSGEPYYSYHDPVTQNINPAHTCYRFSRGMAIKAGAGTEVKAAWEGRVVSISQQGYPYGQAVTVQHDNGLEVYYGALQEIVVEEGDRLCKGEGLGYLAGGLQADLSYLYLEVLKDKEPVDPVQYLP